MTSLRLALLAVAALLLANGCNARYLTSESQEDQAPASCLPPNATVCKPALPESLAPPQGALVAAVVTANGTQNYTCVGGKYALQGAKTDLYYDYEPGMEPPVFAGYLYTQEASGAAEDRLPTFVFTDPNNATVAGLVTTVRGNTWDVEPADSDVNSVWYRRPVEAAEGAAFCDYAYVVRTDVAGGAAPAAACGAADPQAVEVPYTGVYTFYLCAAADDE